MIKDKLEHSTRYESVHPLFKKAFEFLQKSDVSSLSEGKHMIDGDNIFALVQEYKTKSAEGNQAEAHRKHIDIQYVVKGKELMGHTTLYNQTESKSYNDNDDYALYNEEYSFIKVNSGEFTVFFPHDIHMPCIKVNEEELVTKIVIKIKL